MTSPVTPVTTNVAAVLVAPSRLVFEERPAPVPGTGEALVRITSVGICGSDTSYFRGTATYPMKAPFVMGHEAAGVIEQMGPGHTSRLRSGVRVALIPNRSCGSCEDCTAGFDNLCHVSRYLGSAAVTPHQDGALQRLLVMPVSHLLPVPDHIDDATAALLEPLAVALHAVRKVSVEGQKVLVVGGGAIGQLTALVARSLGAAHITVIDTSVRRAALAVTHGADSGCTPNEVSTDGGAGERFDMVFDASGHPDGVDLALRVARPGTGRVILVGNLPADHALPIKRITRAESWVTSTFRFAGGLRPALEFIEASGVDISWLREESVPFENLEHAFRSSMLPDPPLKIHIAFPTVSPLDQNPTTTATTDELLPTK